ncbi:MAG: preprotein translocase subunit SecE [Eggerthellaceae bacterium]|jgi:TRAP-type C4-dicarboxylate transport system permease small subunit|nr:preprotein translocase subunit SecE [Eggerthellaceae bacterium]MDR2715756.1 hypothetical protein [Coriobacteriaceae bacterium]
MKETAKYLKWLSILCVLMALFGIAIFALGYQVASPFRVATVVALFIGSGVFAFFSRRQSQ